jgi:hypothetical protein
MLTFRDISLFLSQIFSKLLVDKYITSLFFPEAPNITQANSCFGAGVFGADFI